MSNYYLGLDVGIGSIGWAIINVDKKRLEDFGVRIFDSGENTDKNKKKERHSQERRRFRGMRRLVRRKKHRKLRLKNYLQVIGLTTVDRINEYYENGNNNVIQLRYKGLSEKLTPEQIAACLIHICNNRGYQDFYDVDVESFEDKDAKDEYIAINHINEIMRDGNYLTPAQMICECSEFEEPNSVFRKYHNKEGNTHINIISRPFLIKEVSLLLQNQQKHYDCIDETVITNIKNIIFAQRDFETGPGNENDRFRKFTGYLDTLGKCQYFKDFDRGCRFTLIADIYSLVNTLSQYIYIDKDNNNCFTKELANELINVSLKQGNLQKKDLRAIAKKHGITINDNNSDTTLTKCFKYIKAVKPIFESHEFVWEELISNYKDENNNLLNQVGIILSQAQTPKRRINKLKALPYNLSDELIMDLSRLKLSGTAKVSYEYMRGSIDAFCEGDIYGKYQAQIIKDTPTIDESSKPKKLPPFKNEDDCEFFKNPVVFRAINETRKIINAIIDKYGYPAAVNIETADELNKTFEDRAIDTKRKKDNEKNNDRIVNEISECLNCSESEARPLMDKYKLWEAQEGKCLYSGKDIVLDEMLKDNDKKYEIDHIIPYSLILDNTLNNKALVTTTENQQKGQQTPLMYMDKSKASEFRKKVNTMYKNKKISKKKYNYLMLENLDKVDLLDEWKSRNLNDTRYICKYLVNYLKSNLRFDRSHETEDVIERKEHLRVYAVKSAFTSMFRRQWLNEKTWGRYDKSDLKKNTYLDHAADAIVIANCRPEYVVLAGEKRKLSKMYHNAGKRITPEYKASKKACIDSLYMYYGMDKNTSNRLLSGKSTRLTPIIPNLRDEVDKRLLDKNIFEKLWQDRNDMDCEDIYTENMLSLYHNDPEFAESLKMPLISLKPDRKYRGAITDENAISIKEINGEYIQLTRKSIREITKDKIEFIYTDDKTLIDSLNDVFSHGNYKNVDAYLKETNQPFFVTSKGKRVNKVTLMRKAPARWLTKNISENNYTFMTDRKYYCIELYKDSKGNNNLLGIAMSDIVHKNGKLYLKPDYKYPDDYCTHVMYIFSGDYLRIKDSKGRIKVEGYYRSIKSANRNELYFTINNNPEYQVKSIRQTDLCTKLSVDILGKVNGEIKGSGVSCGEPLSLLKEKN